mmetsp:Transcript_92211/g.276687  ORF Transcript_92211/g.276687 Transcript_92211/m.276687 type:complete len:103 (-) Transcript_92211:48-356(-)
MINAGSHPSFVRRTARIERACALPHLIRTRLPRDLHAGDIASGKTDELVDDMLWYRDRWDAAGRLTHHPVLKTDDSGWVCPDKTEWCLLRSEDADEAVSVLR